MTHSRMIGMVLLAATFACSACSGENSRTATIVTPTSQQVAVIKWDEAISATTAARVNNTSLIFMR